MNSFFLIIILLAAVVIVPIWMKKRKDKQVAEVQSQRRNKDEVWKTIKQFLKDNNEYGKEIFNSYVIKRNNIDYINPNAPKQERKNKKIENKLRKKQNKEAKKEAKKANIPYKEEPVRDLYVVLFSTRDPKTGVIINNRAIECEVVNKKINKKEWDRKILIHGELNYDKEMEWIAPIKANEEAKNAKNDARAKALAEKQAAKKAKKNAKKKAKEEKKKNKDE